MAPGFSSSPRSRPGLRPPLPRRPVAVRRRHGTRRRPGDNGDRRRRCRRSKQGVASAVNDVSRELGGALGIAVSEPLNGVYRAKVADSTGRLPPAPRHARGRSPPPSSSESASARRAAASCSRPVRLPAWPTRACSPAPQPSSSGRPSSPCVHPAAPSPGRTQRRGRRSEPPRSTEPERPRRPPFDTFSTLSGAFGACLPPGAPGSRCGCTKWKTRSWAGILELRALSAFLRHAVAKPMRSRWKATPGSGGRHSARGARTPARAAPRPRTRPDNSARARTPASATAEAPRRRAAVLTPPGAGRSRWRCSSGCPRDGVDSGRSGVAVQSALELLGRGWAGHRDR